MNTCYSSSAHSLVSIRLQLIGPIAQSPFSGSDKQAKIDYCNRQIKLLVKWISQRLDASFVKHIVEWEKRIEQINDGKL